ncbi:gasdermin-E [Denticeps clupeoides]|uniref:gasdermin-E n=1 Tax=Denticeps clupeoides TaxID=299321 RepID=UPI0010A59035|nr:gasdermin-E-like [Denticeps clupeoides]
MLGKATGHLVRQIDPDGSLIGVSRLADSDRLQPLGVVLKRPGRWPWSRAKYRPTDFTLTHITTGRKSPKIELITTDFMNYKGTYTEKMGGALHAEMGGARMQAEGRGSSQLQSSFGKLRKEVVNVRMLLDSSEDRLVDLHHPLVQQTGSQLGSVLAVLKQRIITSSPCSIMFSGLQRGTCSAVLRALGSRSIQVSVSESTSVQLDSDVSMEIPPNTVLAYSVIDLLIKENGNYEFCLQPEVQGGFASGRTSRRSWVDEVDHGDGARVEPDQEKHGAGIPLVNIQQQLMQVKIDLQHLCCLVDSTRSDLLHLLTSLLPDHVSLWLLEEKLDDLCSGDPTCLQSASTSSSQNGSTNEGSSSPNAPSIRAMHLLVSALEELPPNCLDQLVSCCSDGLLSSINQLVAALLGSQILHVDELPPHLQSAEFLLRAEQLLDSAGVALKREMGGVWAESQDTRDLRPLLLCVAVHGLNCLSSTGTFPVPL